MSKVLCYIFSCGDRFKSLANCAGRSFKQWHPHIDTLWEHYTEIKNEPVLGLAKFKYAYNAVTKGNYDKVIILGSDTITCSYLNEFFNNKEDILCTLDYPYRLKTEYVTTPRDGHVNADVVCFNNINALNDIINLAINYPTVYHEQGALNQLLYSSNIYIQEYGPITKYTSKIVDAPYDRSNVIYNARAKGNIVAESGSKPWKKYTTQFKVIDNKLISYDNKHIKVWHYCDGLGGLSNEGFNELINKWKFEWFNTQTKQFFTSQCNCGDFFNP